MSIKTCLFDMGNVLVYFSHQKMYQNIAAVCDVSVEEVRTLVLDDGLNIKLECGKISEEEYHAAFERHLGKSVDFAALKHAVADIFELNESIVPLLDELKRIGIRLVLLSNTSVTHLRFIQQNFDVLNRFDAMTTSYEVGALKPKTVIYEDALANANCEPQHCFYTDDIEDYITAARELGINAHTYTTTASAREALRELGVDVAV